ncbi:aspartate dehydrogenase [Methanocaldococcus indicus]|uniref:aspartate dehydrogenase n=1 Tax=Methanocaldococcus indicus TaxID=213231 RepID=UPI003C6D26AC
MSLKIGLVGCGAVGNFIVKKINEGMIKAKLIALYDRNYEKSLKLAKILDVKACKSLDELVKEDIDLVVEAASINAVEEVVKKSILNNRDVLILSVGAFADKNLFLNICKLLKNSNNRVYIPSGAVAGLDALKVIKYCKNKRVKLRTVKSPKSLGVDVKEETILFRGNALDAIKKFPANINVAITLSLAVGYPIDVEIVANPNIDKNRHEIYVESDISNIKIILENKPLKDNPKTSALAAYSIVKTINEIQENIRIV